MRLRSILPFLALVALAGCGDTAQRPKIASKDVATTVTTPLPAATPGPQASTVAGAVAANCCACPTPTTVKACPPAMAPERAAPAAKVRHRVTRHVAPVRVATHAPVRTERRYVRVERPVYTPAPRYEDARVEQREDTRIEQRQVERRDYAREEFEHREMQRRDLQRRDEERQAFARAEFARQDLERRDFERREFERRDFERRELARREDERRRQARYEDEQRTAREYAWREQEARRSAQAFEQVRREERYQSSVRYSERSNAESSHNSGGYVATSSSGCGSCVRPAAGRDSNGFLTWPGKR